MKISIASPATGTQKSFEIDDEKKLVQLHEKRIAQDFPGEFMGDQFKGYIFKITGGQDKEGFPMKQGVLTNCRVRLLLQRGDVGYQAWRGRKGERRRKSVRGCIVAGDIALLNCIIVKEGPEKIEGLNDHIIPRRLGPKRASKIRKLFNLTKEDDVRKYVIRRYLPPKEGKDGKMRRGRSKAPKIQRLVTPVVIERWRRRRRTRVTQRIKVRKEKQEYIDMVSTRKKVSARRKKCLLLAAMAQARKKEIRKLSKTKCKTIKKHEKVRAKKQAEAKAKGGKKHKKEGGKPKTSKKPKAGASKPSDKKAKKPAPPAEDQKKAKKPKTAEAAPAPVGKASKPKPAAPGKKGQAPAAKPAPAPAKPKAASQPKAKPETKPEAKKAPAKPSAKPEGKKPAKPEGKKASSKPAAAAAPAAKKTAKPEGKKAGGGKK